MRVAVVGAGGYIGRRVATELIRSDLVEVVGLCSRDPRGTPGGAPDGGTVAIDLDIRSSQAARVLAGYDVVISCAGPAGETELAGAKAAVGARAHYISLCDEQDAFEKVTELDASARAAGVCLISGCGLSPGITNLLAARAAEGLEHVHEIDIATAWSFQDGGGPAHATHLLNLLGHETVFVSDHRRWRWRAGGDPRFVFLPEPVAWTETFASAHPEVVSLLATYPDLRALAYRTGLTERGAMDVLRASARLGFGTRWSARTWVLALRRLGRLLGALPPSGPAWTGARVDVRGAKDGREETRTLGVADRLANLVVGCISIAALELGSGRCEPGVRTPSEAFDARSFLARLVERGVRIARLDPERV